MPDTELFIGLMSGTSADSIDAALVDLSDGRCQLLATHSSDISDLKQEIHALGLRGDNEIQRLGQLDRELGVRFAKAANQLLTRQKIPHKSIRAIGSHGQTLRHQPPSEGQGHPFSLQVGDPNTIAHHTGITTVADFRRRDIALGGQGAPLVPAFHRAAFHAPGISRAIVNIGGIANITLLPADEAQPTEGHDTGPGNGLMDAWIWRHRQRHFDDDGDWARRGKVIPALLERLLRTPYLAQPAPKSTGRELFNIDWLDRQLEEMTTVCATADVQRTLLEFTAASIADAVTAHHTDAQEVYLCGGGVRNRVLSGQIAERLAPRRVATTDELGIPPDWVEAAAFAWLARQTLHGLPGNAPEVTGAREAAILGAIYPA